MLDKIIDEKVKDLLLRTGKEPYNKRKISSIFRMFYDGVWIADDKRKIIYANQRIINKLKCQSDNIIDKEFMSFVYDDDQKYAEDIMQKPISEKSLYKLRLRCFDNTEIFTKCYIKPYFSADKYIGSIVIFRDNLEK